MLCLNLGGDETGEVAFWLSFFELVRYGSAGSFFGDVDMYRNELLIQMLI